MSQVDLSSLPPPSVIEPLDYETLLAERKTHLIGLYPADQQAAVARSLELESEPQVKLLQENAYRELLLRQRINEASSALMLAYSRGYDLDQLAANVSVSRQVVTPADVSTIPPTLAILESDSALRERVQLAYEGLSVAGPRQAYIKHGRDADHRVADISAESPAPAEVVVSVLSREGDGSASADLVEVVRVALNDDEIRPLGDRLTVQSVEVSEYQIIAAVYVYQGPEVEPIRIAAEASLQAYVNEQRRIGRDINRSAIAAALHVAGVKRVVLAEPAADLVLTRSQAAYCTGYQIDFEAEDE